MAKRNYLALVATVGIAAALSACSDRSAQIQTPTSNGAVQKTAVWVKSKPSVTASVTERECLARAMYFESNRSSTEGMLAVGSVVMNRLESGRYGDSICSVVGAPRQFAPGVLSRPMVDRSAPMVREVANYVLSGDRHARVGRAMHFHMAGLRFSYNNMHYVTVAGGNAFYEKRDRRDLFTPSIQTAALQEERPVQTFAAIRRDSETHSNVYSSEPNNANVTMANLVQPAAEAPRQQNVSVEETVTKAAISAQIAPMPLPPPRPKLLGLSPTKDKQAAIDIGNGIRVSVNKG